MANKRTATTDLNHDNWDEDEEAETSGRFQAAQPSVIARRQIRVATRRLNNSSSGDPACDTSNEHRPEKPPCETSFLRLGSSFSSTGLDKKPSFFTSSVGLGCKLKPSLSTNPGAVVKAPQPLSPTANNTMENKDSKEDSESSSNGSSGDDSLPTSAFRPVKPAKSPFTYEVMTGPKSTVVPTSVEIPIVHSSNNSTWHNVTAIKPPQSKNSLMPCLETRPVADSKSCTPSKNTEVLGKKDSRHLLKPVPDDIMARLKTKSDATAKSLNFLKRTYQLNTTTVDWLNILVNESLTVNIAEVIPSYMHELLKLIEDEILCQGSEEVKKQLVPHRNQLQQMMELFRQFGYLVEGENSSKSETLPGTDKGSSSKSPITTNKLESSPQSSKSRVTNKDTPWKINTDQEMQQNTQTVQNEPHSVVLNENHSDGQQNNDHNDTDDESSQADPCTPIVEEGSICTMRCKVFVKKVVDPSDPVDTPYQNRGLGSLYIKPISRGKLQFVVRADNTLGNIILNTCITPDIPIEIANSNTLMLVCSPMPGDSAKTVLIRVKNKLHVDLLHTNLATN